MTPSEYQIPGQSSTLCASWRMKPCACDVGLYVFRDWRERVNWKESAEYGPDAW
jgi:hypothetical protein